ncbi:MAG: 4-(cytidine 5'-diphospho)-2-C-methyl-D-erythritol kinase [Clostridiales bacterium]
MESIKLKAKAKINLSLDVIRKREDGYHDLKMIMQNVDLYDEIFLEKIKEGITVNTDSDIVPNGKGNIAYKAAFEMKKKYGFEGGLKIYIKKKIPVEAGLAGGSSDAASIIKGINKIFMMNLNENELLKVGKSIGADVPFCIKGGTQFSEGIGDKLTEIELLDDVNIIIIKPSLSISTSWAYKNLNLNDIENKPNSNSLLEAVNRKDVKYIAQNMKNVFESLVEKKYNLISKVKEDLVKFGALGSLMSGSGSSVFGIFEDVKVAKMAETKLFESGYKIVIRTKTCK